MKRQKNAATDTEAWGLCLQKNAGSENTVRRAGKVNTMSSSNLRNEPAADEGNSQATNDRQPKASTCRNNPRGNKDAIRHKTRCLG